MIGPGARNVVLVDGCRLPFQRSGGAYAELTSYDLARAVLEGLLARVELAPAEVDAVILGSVVQNPATSNVARDAALAAGFPARTPASTVTMACISANRAIADGAARIRTGEAEAVVAGGVEVLSDVPIGFSKAARQRFFESRRYRRPQDWLRFLRGLSPSDLLPRAPAIAEYTTGETMGESADRLAAAFGVTREAQDRYALRSQQRAAAATDAGKLAPGIHPAALPPDFQPRRSDGTLRRDTSLEKLAQLPPAFVKPFGTVTAGNASPLTDGAAALLLMRQEAAAARGLPALARLRAHVFTAQDPGEELLLGPAYAVPQLLDAAGVTFGDLDVIEIHEAFAGQVLAVLAAWDSERFAREALGRSERVTGAAGLDPERLNRWGGSLSLGHPFGATGARLLHTAAARLHDEDGELALVTACAAGGLGHAMLLERVAA